MGVQGWPAAEGAIKCLEKCWPPPKHASTRPYLASEAGPSFQAPRLPSQPGVPWDNPFTRPSAALQSSAEFLAALSTAPTVSRAVAAPSPQAAGLVSPAFADFTPFHTMPTPSSGAQDGSPPILQPTRLFRASHEVSFPPPSVNSRTPELLRARTPDVLTVTPNAGGSTRLGRSSTGSSSCSSLASAMADRITAGLDLSANRPPFFRSPPPLAQPSASNPPLPLGLLNKARDVRRAYSEGPECRQLGGRLSANDGSDAELTTPIALTSELDAFLQQRLLGAAFDNLSSSSQEHSRQGVSKAAFEAAWNHAAFELSTILTEATGADPNEVVEALSNNSADASVALLTLLHRKGDSFQQACAQAAAVELQNRRQGQSLATIVEDAARQGNLPADLSCKKLLRNLQNYLPLTEIMGHRYRTNPKANRVAFQESRKGSRSESKSPRSASRNNNDESDDDDEASGDDSGSESEDDNVDEDASNSDFLDESGSAGASDSDGSSESSDSDVVSDVLSGDTSDSDRSRRRSHRKGGRRGRSSRDRRNSSTSNLVAAPPPNWVDGDAPNGGYFLETFTKIYQQFRSFKKMHRGTGLLFRDLIQPDIEPTVLMECGLSSREYRSLSQDDLLSTIKKSLGFNDEDYFTRQLELLRLPNCKRVKAMDLYKAFRKLTTPFLRILGEAKSSGVALRNSNIVRIFKNHIKGIPSLERWFHSKKFKTFNSALKFISGKIRECITKEIEDAHDERVSAGAVAGATGRSDCQGGKSESGQAVQKNRNQKRRLASRDERPPKRQSVGDKNSRSSKYPHRSSEDESAFQAALQMEKDLPNGMYFHPRGPFCTQNPCKAKVCQGCNFHADASGRGHIRPNCRCKNHADFVATGYFHERWPNRTGALKLPEGSDKSDGHKFSPPPRGQVRNTAGQMPRREAERS
jgi:hypothetical protein